MSWVLYDLANTIFSMGVLSLYFSLYVQERVGIERADRVYGLITAASMGLIFLVSPLAGAMSDRARRRMPFLIWSTIVCCAATALLARGPFALTIALFILANAAYQAGVQYYDALLPAVSTPETRGRVSGLGVGIGYLGSYLAVGLGFVVASDDKATIFTAIAAAFFCLALPCFLFVRDRVNAAPRPIFAWSAIRESTAETMAALRSTQQFPGLARFLVGRVFYTDAINTVIAYMSLYTVNVAMAGGLDARAGEAQARLVLLSAITFAVAGGLVWGRIVDRRGAKRTLDAVLILWIVTFALAASIGALRLPGIGLYLVGALAGVALGGVWSADRPLMLELTPPDRVGEFYGLYGMVGRFSAISGPLLWSLVMYVSVERGGLPVLTGQSLAILSLLTMVIASFLILRPLRRTPSRTSVAIS